MNRRYLEYLESKEWKEKRKALLSQRGRICELCGSRRSLRIHHLTYERIYHEPPEDLQVLCKVCHDKAHGIDHKPKTIKRKRKRTRESNERRQIQLLVRKAIKNRMLRDRITLIKAEARRLA